MQPLKINFYTNFSHQQGTYFRAHGLATGLQNLGQEVTIFTCDHDTSARAREEWRDGIRYLIIPVSKGTSYIGPFNHPLTALKNAFRVRAQCDVAHLFQPFANAALAWRTAPARVRFYDWDDLWLGGHMGDRPISFRQKWNHIVVKRLEAHLPRVAHHVTAIDHFLYDLAAERGARKATLLYNPSPPLRSYDKMEARASFSLERDAVYVGFMGFTISELGWCLQAVEESLERFPKLRFAVCGQTEEAFGKLNPALAKRVTALGRLPSQEQARAFASSLDLALLPLEDNNFNQSRFPIKFSEYLMAGTAVYCSEIGECALMNSKMPWVIGAGKTREEWLQGFPDALSKVVSHEISPVDIKTVTDIFSQETICQQLLSVYRSELPASPPLLKEAKHSTFTG